MSNQRYHGDRETHEDQITKRTVTRVWFQPPNSTGRWISGREWDSINHEVTEMDQRNTRRQEGRHVGNEATPQTGATVKGYRTLGADELAMMNELKRTSALFIEQLEIARKHVADQYRTANAANTSAEKDRLEDAEPYRWLSMAKTDMQRACMAACRAVAQPEGNS